MKRVLLLFIMASLSHFLFAQVTPVQPKTTTVNVKSIPADQAIQIRTNTKQLKTELEKLRDSLALIQTDLNMLIGSMNVKTDSKNEMSAAEAAAMGELNNQMQSKMQEMQAKFETASKMTKYVDSLRKSIMSNWPQSR